MERRYNERIAISQEKYLRQLPAGAVVRPTRTDYNIGVSKKTAKSSRDGNQRKRYEAFEGVLMAASSAHCSIAIAVDGRLIIS